MPMHEIFIWALVAVEILEAAIVGAFASWFISSRRRFLCRRSRGQFCPWLPPLPWDDPGGEPR